MEEGNNTPLRPGTERFVLRRAAETWWLVDVLQTGESYQPALRLNDTGAVLWQAFCQGAPAQEAAAALAREEGLSPAQALEDVQAFFRSLEQLLAQRAHPDTLPRTEDL